MLEGCRQTRRVPQVPVQVDACASPPTETRFTFTQQVWITEQKEAATPKAKDVDPPRLIALPSVCRTLRPAGRPVLPRPCRLSQREGPPALSSEGARGRQTSGEGFQEEVRPGPELKQKRCRLGRACPCGGRQAHARSKDVPFRCLFFFPEYSWAHSPPWAPF